MADPLSTHPDDDPHTAVILAAHGAPATNYPARQVVILMALTNAGERVERIPPLRSWRDAIDREVRAWPRTPANDPYKLAAEELAAAIARQTGRRVFVGYNEFCSPTIPAAIDQAAAQGAQNIIVIPTMLLRGNQHTEEEIKACVATANERYPELRFRYIWPFDLTRVTTMFADHIRTCESELRAR